MAVSSSAWAAAGSRPSSRPTAACSLPSARAALERAGRIYGGHMGAGLEAHGIWGTPAQVIERIRRHTALGCTLFVMEFFGRDTREPARLFAERVLPAFR